MPTSLTRDVQVIQRSLGSIARALSRLAPALAAAARGSGNAGAAERKLRLSPTRRASLKLQGQYMGFLRNLKPKEKTRVKALRVKKGIGPAINLARKLARAGKA